MSDMNFELRARVDEDGFVALVCPDTYQGFVNEDWTLEQVLSRFVEQMGAGALFAIYPGPDVADMSVRISDVPSSATAWREVSGLVRVGEGGLWLTDYTQLTMAAQFQDSRPIEDGRIDHIRLPIPSGVYQITARQFSRSYEDEIEPAVELIFVPADPSENHASFKEVPWFS